MNTWRLIHGDAREALRTLPDSSVQTCVTSPQLIMRDDIERSWTMRGQFILLSLRSRVLKHLLLEHLMRDLFGWLK